ncbi:transposase [uncultured Dubosiella sp.]|uniref:RNA-guided endonuclease InsQ/TnpB family protein n=1 Tax=uncultured Dubosiella sp. TaxID=1937011 RepID=UPI00272F77DF|nr:transposase [uncultured Dubosiella sp.]
MFRLFTVSNDPDYFAKGLPRHTAQHMMKQACRDFDTYFKSLEAWKKNPHGQRPNPPRYAKGDYKAAILSNQECKNYDGMLKLPHVKEHIPCRRMEEGRLKEAKIMPYHDVFLIVLTYETKSIKACRQPKRVASIDLGVNNLAAIANNIGKRSLLFSGRVLKSIKEEESRTLSRLASRQTIGTEIKLKSSKRVKAIYRKNGLRTMDFLHKTANAIIRWCVENDIDTLVVGCNKEWKQSADLGAKNNRIFCHIPFYALRQKLKYRCEREGIQYIETEEAYTSKASFYDEDGFHADGLTGTRTTRGNYRRANGEIVNADLNAAANIGRKAFPELFKTDKVDLHHIKRIMHPELA